MDYKKDSPREESGNNWHTPIGIGVGCFEISIDKGLIFKENEIIKLN